MKQPPLLIRLILALCLVKKSAKNVNFAGAFKCCKYESRMSIQTLTSLSRQWNGMEIAAAMALKQLRNCEILTWNVKNVKNVMHCSLMKYYKICIRYSDWPDMCYMYMQQPLSLFQLKSTTVNIMNIIQYMFIAQCCYGVEIKYSQLNMTRGDIKIPSRLLRLTSLFLLIFPKPVRYKTRRYLFPHLPQIKMNNWSRTVCFTPKIFGLIFRNLDTTRWSKGDTDCCKKLVTSSCLCIFKCTERNLCCEKNCKSMLFSSVSTMRKRNQMCTFPKLKIRIYWKSCLDNTSQGNQCCQRQLI